LRLARKALKKGNGPRTQAAAAPQQRDQVHSEFPQRTGRGA
jgi:hypothetical protein